jgi:Protein of unknown function (DUF3662)/FHA domain
LGILRSIESRLERVVEGSVGRLFRASVAPVELARKLAKELEEGKVVSVTQTYAPNEYTIFLSPRDRTRFADFEASLRNELASYLAEHARRAGYVMPTRPRVRFETESTLHTGIFGISTALVRDDDAPLEAPLVPPTDAPPADAPPAMAPPASFPAPSAPPEPFVPAPPVVPPVVEPEQPVRSPLDPDPVEGPPAGFPPVPLEPEPVAEPEPEPEREPLPPPFVPSPPDIASLPDVPLPASMPTPPIPPVPPVPSVPTPPVPSVPLPPLPSLSPLPDAPAAPLPPDPDIPERPPSAEPPPPPPVEPPLAAFEPPPVVPPPPAAFEPPLDATMITRPEAREELVIVHDNQRTPIEGAVLQIGRAPGCDIVLDDRNVSRRHAEIRRRGPVVVLIDLDSTNGTIVNGRRVREHPLADGDRITLGNSRLTFERRTT